MRACICTRIIQRERDDTYIRRFRLSVPAALCPPIHWQASVKFQHWHIRMSSEQSPFWHVDAAEISLRLPGLPSTFTANVDIEVPVTLRIRGGVQPIAEEVANRPLKRCMDTHPGDGETNRKEVKVSICGTAEEPVEQGPHAAYVPNLHRDLTMDSQACDFGLPEELTMDSQADVMGLNEDIVSKHHSYDEIIASVKKGDGK